MKSEFNSIHCFVLLVCLALGVACQRGFGQTPSLPPGFVIEQFGSDWFEVVGITFAEDGTMFAWQRGDNVRMYRNNQWYTILDPYQEVGSWRDHGLLGFAIDPNFLNNGRIYLLYVVDRHYLLHYGTPDYNPFWDEYFNATIGRITRYTLDVNNNFETVVPDSRTILLGETPSTGIPILFESHGVGSLVFGTDGTLLVSCGDGASYNGIDTGGDAGGSYAPQALADGIIRPKEDVGAFRAQLVDSLSGKILRLDPNTGDGVPSNPFYDPAAPRAPRSRVWALGLRNPCRITLRPDSGSHNPDDGSPGVLCIGDVGMDGWEDFNICTAGGQNFGWPIYEGFDPHPDYSVANVANLDAPNPLYGSGGCTQQFFYFRDLLIQDTPDPNPSFPNPCNAGQQIPASIPRFTHRRPEMDWGHNAWGPARAGTFVNGVATTIDLGDPGCPVSGEQFAGNCSLAGVWYTAKGPPPSFPPEYYGKYLHCDYGQQWIKRITMDANNKATAIEPFLSAGEGGSAAVISLAMDPTTGDLYMARWEQVLRIRYAPTGNQPPIAVASADVNYGPSPLTVHFTGSNSTDPENQPLQYSWNFGDGQTSMQANPTHTFTAPDSQPHSFTTTLTVKDSGNLTAQATVLISLNNTPPAITIISPVAGSMYALEGNSTYWLRADVTDAEQGAAGISCQWQTILHHNNHEHQEPIDHNCLTTTVISPVGCDGNTFYYRITFTATDTAGLSATREVDLYPDCTGNSPPIANDDSATVAQNASTPISVLSNDSDSDGTLNPAAIAVIHVPQHGEVSVNPSTGVLTYLNDGSAAASDSFTYTVNDNAGGTSNLATVALTITPATPGDIDGDGHVNVSDLLAVISGWNCVSPPQSCPADVAPPPNGDGQVNVTDLLYVISHWG